MEATQIWANLAVDDLSRTTKFYQALGFKRNGRGDAKDLVSFFFGDDDFVIHFFERLKLESNTGMKTVEPGAGNEVMFSISVTSEEEIQRWYKTVLDAGGRIHRQPSRDEQGFFWFVFADPDGHRFNILLVEPGM